MSAPVRTSITVSGSPRASADAESPRGESPQKPPRPSSPAPQRSPKVESSWRRATPEGAPPSPPSSPREAGKPRPSASISLGSREKPVSAPRPEDDLKRNPQVKRLAQELPDQPAPKRARTASPPASPRTSSPRAAPAQDAVQADAKAAPSIPALTLAKAQLERDCIQAKQCGENLTEVATLAENMQFRVKDVSTVVQSATEDLDHMICCPGDPDKHEKVEKYREAVQGCILRLFKIFKDAPSSIKGHEYYAYSVTLISAMQSLLVEMQADQPLVKTSLVDSPGRGERGRASPRAGGSPRADDGRTGAVRKPLRVVMDPQKSAASEKGRADS